MKDITHLHRRLSNNVPWYKEWHEHPAHILIHYGFAILITAFVMALIVSSSATNAALTVQVTAQVKQQKTNPLTTWRYCAKQGETCFFPNVKQVRYGANHIYVYKTATSSIECSNRAFNPRIKNTANACYYSVTY